MLDVDAAYRRRPARLAQSAIFSNALAPSYTVTVAAGFAVDFLEPAREGDRLVAICVERALKGRSGVYDVTVRRSGPGGSEGDVVAELRGRSRSLGTPIG